MFERGIEFSDFDAFNRLLEKLDSIMNISRSELFERLKDKNIEDIEKLRHDTKRLREGMRNHVTKLEDVMEKMLLPLCDKSVTRKYLCEELLAIGDSKHPKDPSDFANHFVLPADVEDVQRARAALMEAAKESASGYAGVMGEYKKIKKLASRVKDYLESRQAEKQTPVTVKLSSSGSALFKPAPEDKPTNVAAEAAAAPSRHKHRHHH